VNDEQMKRLVIFLLLKQGGEVTLTEREIMDAQVYGQAIEFSSPRVGSGDIRVRVVPDPALEPTETERPDAEERRP